MHTAAYNYVKGQVDRHGHFRSVVEIGARNINGSVRPLFGSSTYVATDIVDGPGVDVVADGATYQPSRAPDCVVCCEVLEHTASAGAIVANARLILAPGGWLVLTCAGLGRAPHSAIDGNGLRPGEYYRNVDVSDLCSWLDGMTDITVNHDPSLGDIYGTARKPGGDSL